jgi:hypothetical protein
VSEAGDQLLLEVNCQVTTAAAKSHYSIITEASYATFEGATNDVVLQ